MKTWNEHYWGNICQAPDVNEVISAAKSKYSKAKSDKEYAEYVYNLTFEDYLDTIRTSPYVWRYRLPYIEDAINELSSKGRKPNLHMVEDWIAKDFFDSKCKIKIKEIISTMSGHAYYIQFNIDNVTYQLDIPVREALTVENIIYAYCGKYALLFEESKSCWDLICIDYTEEGMKDKIKQYFEQKVAK